LISFGTFMEVDLVVAQKMPGILSHHNYHIN